MNHTSPTNLARLLTVLAVSVASAPVAHSASFTFEDEDAGYYAPALTVSNQGLTLTITPEDNPNGYVRLEDGQDATVPVALGSKAVTASLSNPLERGQFLPLRFTFSQLISKITFAFGDNGGDSDSPVTIEAFDADDTLLDTMTETHPDGFSAGKTLSGSFSGAQYFILSSGTQSDNPNSIFWEVTSLTVVPEPSTVGLLAVGIAGAFGWAGVRRARPSRSRRHRS